MAWLAAALVLVVAGVLVSVMAARGVARSDAARARLAFRAGAAEVASTLKLAIQHEQDLVLDTSAFFARDPGVSPANFDRWVESAQAFPRYPELQDIGVVDLVPAGGLAAFERHVAADPALPLGPSHPAPKERFVIMPPGRRPYYCFAVDGLERSLATYLPDGVDFCALAPSLIGSRVSGGALYAPVMTGPKTTLGIETPVYRGGGVPASVAARKRAFLGWLGEVLEPEVVLVRALEAHPGIGVRFRYGASGSAIAFSVGRRPPRAQTTTIDLHNGWTVQTFGAEPKSGVYANNNALELLVGGVILSLLGGTLALVLATGRQRALGLVREDERAVPPRPPRHPHRASQPSARARPREAAPGADGPRRRHGRRRALHRHRRLQAGQRHARTRRRGQAPAHRRRTAAAHPSAGTTPSGV